MVYGPAYADFNCSFNGLTYNPHTDYIVGYWVEQAALRLHFGDPDPMKKKLTEANVLTLPTRSKPYHVHDFGSEAAHGLSVLVSPNGIRTFRATYYFPGSRKGRAVKLGRVGEMTLDAAREKTRAVRGLARRGLDPRKGDPAKSDNFKTAVEIWTEREQIGRKGNRSAEQCSGFLLSACRGWHGRPIGAILYHEIEELLHFKRDVAPYSANRLHAHLATFFRWCKRTHRIAVNPMAEMPKPWNGGKPRQLDWFSGEGADEVVRGLWTLADQLGGDDAAFIKLLVITGKRKNAVKGMALEQIVNHFWTPPPGSKTKRNHPIPLPKLAQRIMGKGKAGPIIKRVDPALQSKVRKALKLENFIWHGVRHIVESKLAELKVPFHIRDLLLDHAPVRGAGRGYDHHSYEQEMLEALERWCGHIEQLVTPKGVRRLR